MKLSFFDWIREGVRQSVLLGLADAASHIGSPEEAEDLNRHLVATIQHGRISLDAPESGRGKRKALGRSLQEIVNE